MAPVGSLFGGPLSTRAMCEDPSARAALLAEEQKKRLKAELTARKASGQSHVRQDKPAPPPRQDPKVVKKAKLKEDLYTFDDLSSDAPPPRPKPKPKPSPSPEPAVNAARSKISGRDGAAGRPENGHSVHNAPSTSGRPGAQQYAPNKKPAPSSTLPATKGKSISPQPAAQGVGQKRKLPPLPPEAHGRPGNRPLASRPGAPQQCQPASQMNSKPRPAGAPAHSNDKRAPSLPGQMRPGMPGQSRPGMPGQARPGMQGMRPGDRYGRPQGGRPMSRYHDEEDEYEDDFVVDDDEEEADWRQHIRRLTGYDPRRYRDDGDDRSMEASWRDIMMEEKRSERMARREDEIEEEMERKRKEDKMKKRLGR
mmetsp:Transcript_22294/g.48701  ORF Transcript_22294/g.48701 Transcript_22294/m.48701 type:complete len:366 (-) Transcript_22294:875-1972(-)